MPKIWQSSQKSTFAASDAATDRMKTISPTPPFEAGARKQYSKQQPQYAIIKSTNGNHGLHSVLLNTRREPTRRAACDMQAAFAMPDLLYKIIIYNRVEVCYTAIVKNDYIQ